MARACVVGRRRSGSGRWSDQIEFRCGARRAGGGWPRPGRSPRPPARRPRAPRSGSRASWRRGARRRCACRAPYWPSASPATIPGFAAGRLPCSGHECQKHPSMNTATRWRVNTMSGRHLRSASTSGWSTRNRRPRRWIARRTASSGPVSRRLLAIIVARAAGLDAGGVRGRIAGVACE